MNNLQYKIGNVYKKDQSLYVITNIDYTNSTCTLLGFDSNILEGAPFERKNEKHLCCCDEDSEDFCIICGGDGYYFTISAIAMEDFVFVANTIRQYLIKKFID